MQNIPCSSTNKCNPVYQLVEQVLDARRGKEAEVRFLIITRRVKRTTSLIQTQFNHLRIFIQIYFSLFRSCSLGLFMSTVFYIASMCGIAYMFSQHGTQLSCSINIFFITWTAVLLIVMMVISLHSKVHFEKIASLLLI